MQELATGIKYKTFISRTEIICNTLLKQGSLESVGQTSISSRTKLGLGLLFPFLSHLKNSLTYRIGVRLSGTLNRSPFCKTGRYSSIRPNWRVPAA